MVVPKRDKIIQAGTSYIAKGLYGSGQGLKSEAQIVFQRGVQYHLRQLVRVRQSDSRTKKKEAVSKTCTEI